MSKIYTNQEAFDIAWRHFVIEKNGPSVITDATIKGGFSCRYRGENGARCAFGLFIPDEAYGPWMEGNSVDSLYDGRGLGLATEGEVRAWIDGRPEIDVEFADALQRCHDGSTDPCRDFHTEAQSTLTNLAKSYGLTIPALSLTPVTGETV